MNVGDIYLKKMNSEKFQFFKIVFANKRYCLIAVYEKVYKRKPKIFNLNRKPKLVPAHENGWMVAPFLLSTVKKWDIEQYNHEPITDMERATVEGWRALCGPKIMKPE